MNPWVNYHHLYYFHVVATEGGIAKAAKKLKLGQPSISAQIRQLEKQLDVELFERSHKTLTLTETGKIAYEYTSEIFKLGSEMLQVLQDNITHHRSHVQLGALDSIPKHLIYELCKSAHQTAP
ncbi:MAG: LysR family transcriptional regulator, partial [Proteobacteria bacterium]|nr:LysR family transcriptional regulator [Pseudomonadota bacterium]